MIIIIIIIYFIDWEGWKKINCKAPHYVFLSANYIYGWPQQQRHRMCNTTQSIIYHRACRRWPQSIEWTMRRAHTSLPFQTNRNVVYLLGKCPHRSPDSKYWSEIWLCRIYTARLCPCRPWNSREDNALQYTMRTAVEQWTSTNANTEIGKHALLWSMCKRDKSTEQTGSIHALRLYGVHSN